MAKIKTFRKRRTFSSRPSKLARKRRDKSYDISLREDRNIEPLHAAEKLQDIHLIGTAVMQCLIANDPDGAMDAIESHLEAMNLSRFLKQAKIPRSTMYKLFKTKNPTIKTLAKIVSTAHSQ
ncbi:MAG: hypothetical protein HY069_03065 [Chlamydiia bacterium]|nr:hypothetical protein [Chlamydiia bacterium]